MRHLKLLITAQAPVGHEYQLEEAALLSLASDPGLSLLRRFPAAFCPSTSYQTGTGAVRNRQEGRRGEISFSRGQRRRRGAPRMRLPRRSAGSRMSREKHPSLRAERTDA